ncbi:MAG: bifunctional 4-hydroxy-2-oxoglutarate aldolase/2-dehydro-3-deoxy-phosphogluconate aldolase [Oscillospiraceae bacterium]|jgi:2-dehydro-3-deoxyphosphogluconate aldolase/(4S)-4-hydroxy-2-oxoglutarate aldolase
MCEIFEQISKIGIVPVIKIDDADKALPLAGALIKGGLPVAEVTFRTDEAAEAISRIAEKYPEMLVGAGTVLTTAQVDSAVKAGAKFIVAPGFNPSIVKYCQEKGVPMIPGCSSPTDIEAALELGLDTVKFFPAEAAGGLAMIKAMSAPYGNVKFMPTGGISPKNLNEYLSFSKIVACGGSWMVTDALLKEERYDEITALAQQAVMTMLGFKLVHIGINAGTGDAAMAQAKQFAALFGMAINDGEKSIFMDDVIEIMKFDGRGTNGHIAIQTNDIHRAMYYLAGKGISFIEDSKTYDANGKLNLVYLEGEIGGFAIHLKQKA